MNKLEVTGQSSEIKEGKSTENEKAHFMRSVAGPPFGTKEPKFS